MQCKPVGDDRCRVPLAFDVGNTDGQDIVLLWDLATHGAIGAFMLKEHDGIVVADRSLQQALRIVGGRGGHDLQPRSVSEIGLGAL